ncbi:hypothetical protein [Salinarimonas sp.]|uniref:hypothetical protein n=1 Tax=Salinarimonas sp. TaxID=2766526 RepID=UPI003918D838
MNGSGRKRRRASLFALLAVLFHAILAVQLVLAVMARTPLPGRTIFVLNLAFALPLLSLTAFLLWRAVPVGDLLAIQM